MPHPDADALAAADVAGPVNQPARVTDPTAGRAGIAATIPPATTPSVDAPGSRLLEGFHRDERRLSDRVARYVRNLIITGDLEPGARIREVGMAERLGVSRAPVREAILQLERENLIETQPHRGATVRRIDWEMLREIAHVRTLLEGSVAADFSRHVDGHQGVQLLRERLEAMRAAALVEDRSTLAAAHVAFHRTFVTWADNSVLRGLLTSLWDQSTAFLQVIHARYGHEELHVVVVNQHQELLDAILSGDEAAVARSIHSHVPAIGPTPPPSRRSEEAT